MNFRKNSASVLLGVMALGFSSQMLVSAVDENSNFENKTLQTVSNDPLASDLKNENEGSCLSVDNTNKNVDLVYTDGCLPSGLSKNSKTALGFMSSLSGALATSGIVYTVKESVGGKKSSQNQEGPEQQVDDKNVLEENEENNNQDSGNSDNAGNSEISPQDQTLEKQKSNSGNVMLIVFGVVAFIIIIAVVVVVLVLKYKKKVNKVSNNKVNNLINIGNDNSLINGKDELSKYLKDNNVGKESFLSKFTVSSDNFDGIKKFIADENKKEFIEEMEKESGFDKTLSGVFCYYINFFKRDSERQINSYNTLSIIGNLAEESFNKKLREIKTLDEEKEFQKKFLNFIAFVIDKCGETCLKNMAFVNFAYHVASNLFKKMSEEVRTIEKLKFFKDQFRGFIEILINKRCRAVGSAFVRFIANMTDDLFTRWLNKVQNSDEAALLSDEYSNFIEFLRKDCGSDKDCETIISNLDSKFKLLFSGIKYKFAGNLGTNNLNKAKI